MIMNFWENVKFYCIHNHEKPIPLTIKEMTDGNSSFYSCPKYFLKDEKHPDGHEEGEPSCANRISFNRAATIVDKFMKIVEDNDANGEICDYTGMQFNFDGITVRIIKYDPHDVRIGILNRRVLT